MTNTPQKSEFVVGKGGRGGLFCNINLYKNESFLCKSLTPDAVVNAEATFPVFRLIHLLQCFKLWGSHGFWGSGENGYLFSGFWGALVIILGEVGSKLIILGI